MKGFWIIPSPEYVYDQSEEDEGYHEVGPPVTYERQRHALRRHGTRHYTHICDRLETDEKYGTHSHQIFVHARCLSKSPINESKKKNETKME